jgi:osmoprotectant transport system permease protein
MTCRAPRPVRIANPVLALLLALALAAALGLGFVSHAPNRLLGGAPIPLWQVLAAAPPALLALAGLCAAVWLGGLAVRSSPRWQILVAVAASALLAALLALAGDAARRLAAAASPLARTSLGAGFWVIALSCLLALADALQRLRLKPAGRVAAGAAALLPAIAEAASGALAELSLAKEYANRREVFEQALWAHLHIVGAALLPALLIGWPLGVAAFCSERLARPLLAVLGVIQTVPAIALFGLLVAPLAALGLPGVGMLPAVIALLLYSLLPIVRATAAGLAQVAPPVVEAATAMGMTPRQVFWRVRVAIALPLLFAGLRVCTVQAIGLAVLAALIGAGGFGALVFQGLSSTALDLVLLGVLPVVALALAVDGLLRLAAAAVGPRPA